MNFGRREFIRAAATVVAATRTGASASLSWLGGSAKTSGVQIMNAKKTYDVAVIGAGVFGSWTAWHLAKAGKKVALLDAYGPANARASSAGESRIIRMGYGPDELYTRWSMRSLVLWKEFFAQTGNPLFHRTGVLWLAPPRPRSRVSAFPLSVSRAKTSQSATHNSIWTASSGECSSPRAEH
jgi:glycine/D-amino acid oxidase-like deaminating enzyme